MIFKPSAAAEEFIEGVHARVGARTKAVLGRSALFLALGEGVPANYKPTDAQGKDLNDESVIGDELRDVVRAALNHRAGQALDDSGYKQEFRRHFEFGCQRLRDIWDEAGKDPAKFVTALVKQTGGDLGLQDFPHQNRQASKVVDKPVGLKLLCESEEWVLNDSGGNGLLIISGKPGYGKSQAALDLLAQLSRQGVRFIFFDLKGELEEPDAAMASDEPESYKRKNANPPKISFC